MRKQGLSRRERNMVEEAVTQVCWAMGVSPRDGELRQTAWAEILSVYREDPAGFRGSGMRGWRLACDLAGEAVWKEEQYRQRRKYGELSLDQPVKGDTETTLLQLLHSPAGSCENSVCLWDYLSRQHPDVQRTAQGLLEGETLDQVRDCCRWTRDHAYWAFYTLRAAMEEYLKIQWQRDREEKCSQPREEAVGCIFRDAIPEGVPILALAPSARRATSGTPALLGWATYFYPRPHRGGDDDE